MRDGGWVQRAVSRTGTRRGLAALAAVLFAVGVAGLLAAADWTARTGELGQLLDRIEASEQEMRAANDDFRALMAAGEPGGVQAPQTRLALVEHAESAQEAIAAAGLEVRDTPVLPWHNALRRAQQDYLAHNAAWVQHWQRVGQDPSQAFVEDLAIGVTWTEATDSVWAALPFPEPPGVAPRVHTIFGPAEGEPSDGDSISARPAERSGLSDRLA